jgi:threonine dehydrogenase-like Zn-dependent dehydrogenase
MKRMKAAVLVEKRKFEIQEVPVPEIKETGVLVQIQATAICGTDVAMYTGEHKAKYPIIMGHETAGVVARVGSAVTSVKEKDPVFVISGISCGLCELCRKGKDNLCPHGGLLGREMQGSYAEYLSVPERAVFKLPANFSFIHATTLNLLMTIIHSHRNVRVFPGDSVAVIGLGPAGLAQAHFAKISGANPVIGLGHGAWRGEIAKDFGVDRVILTREEDLIDNIGSAVGNNGVDTVIMAATRPSAIRQAIKIVRPGGTILQFGTMGQVDGVDFYSLYFKEVNIMNSRATVGQDFPSALKWFLNHEDLLSRIVTHTLPLEKIQEGFEMVLDKNKESKLRTVITY